MESRAHVVEGLRHLPREEVDGDAHRQGAYRLPPREVPIRFQPRMRAIVAPPSTGSRAARRTRPGAPGCGRARSARPRAHRRARAGRGSGSAPPPRRRHARARPPRRRAGAPRRHRPRAAPRPAEPGVLSRAMQSHGESSQTIADRGGLFVPLSVGEPTHPRLERSKEPVRGLEGGEEIPDELSVALGVDRAVAGCGQRPMSARAHGAKRSVRPSIACSAGAARSPPDASFARRPCPNRRTARGRCSRRHQRPGERP